MKKMKKAAAVISIIAMTVLLFSGCQKEPQEQVAQEPEVQAVDIRIGGLTGPTSMGLVQLMESAEKQEASNNYIFTISGSADEVTPKLIQGQLDMAAVPANLGAVLYNNTKGAVKILAVNTLGVIYIVEKGNNVNSFEDLRGKKIFATGKGSTPEYALRYLLKENGLDPDKDVILEWKSEPAEVVALLSGAEEGIAMMPQPFVTIAQSKIDGLRIAIDLNKAWDDLDNDSLFITGVLVVRSDFAEKYPEQINKFLDEYKVSANMLMLTRRKQLS